MSHTASPYDHQPTATVHADSVVHPFDTATAVAFDRSQWRAHTSDAYWAFTGPFGGVTAACVLNALLQEPERRGSPTAITVNFTAPLHRGSYEIRTRMIRTGRSTQHWQAEVVQDDESTPHLSALAVFADRPAGWSHLSASPPNLPSRTSLAPYAAPRAIAWTRQYEFWFAEGEPVLGNALLDPLGSSASTLWIDDEPPRPLDPLSLLARSDAFFGRVFHVRGDHIPFGTVTMTTYFFADEAELSSLTDSSTACRVDARRFHRSFQDQCGELWSHDGRLLAVTHQFAYFRAS
jgi:acyl-CoA thioesterase